MAHDSTINVNGLDLRYIDHGGNADLSAVALHGFALNCHSLDEVAPALSTQLHWLRARPARPRPFGSRHRTERLLTRSHGR